MSTNTNPTDDFDEIRPCDVCGEPINPMGLPHERDAGEFYVPHALADENIIAHADCGLAAGFELA